MGSIAEDSKLDNRLTLNISRQMQINMTAILVDADQCYNRINHIVLAFALRAVCGDANIAKAMIESIQHMNYYQRTGRGDSNTFLSAMDELLQGICQGNTYFVLVIFNKIITIIIIPHCCSPRLLSWLYMNSTCS